MKFTMKQIEEIEKVLERDFREVRKRVKKAVDNSPKSVTLADAMKQQKQFRALSK